MYHYKKSFTALGFLLITAAPLFFSISVLVRQQIVQYQREERLEKEKLQTITLSSEAVIWVKAGKEILYNGRLFDVKSYEKKGADIRFTGFFDCKEYKLVQQIEKLALQKNQSGSPFNEQAIKFIFFPAFTVQHETSCCIKWQYLSLHYHEYDEMIPPYYYSVPEHPPC